MNPSSSDSLDLRLAHRASNFGPLSLRTAKRLVATYRSLLSNPLEVSWSESDVTSVCSTVAMRTRGEESGLEKSVLLVLLVVNALVVCASRQRTAKVLMKDDIVLFYCIPCSKKDVYSQWKTILYSVGRMYVVY